MPSDTAPETPPAGGARKVTVNLITRAVKALDRAMGRSGDTQTDVINRAVQMYDYLDEVTTAGGCVLVKRSEDAVPEQIRFF